MSVCPGFLDLELVLKATDSVEKHSLFNLHRVERFSNFVHSLWRCFHGRLSCTILKSLKNGAGIINGG